MKRSQDTLSVRQRRLQLKPGRAASILIQLFAVLGIGWWLVVPAHAQDLPLPVSEYPPQTELTYFPAWTNQQFDCNFGGFCDAGIYQPSLHLLTQDALHRTGGWAIWGEWHDDRMGFELYSSVYSDQVAPDSVPWNRYAAADEQMVLLNFQQAKAARSVPSLLPAGVPGGAFVASLDGPYFHAVFLTVWWGASHEIEAAVLYPMKRRSEARRYLIQQVRTAVQVATGALDG
jgi:hypothetical protein